MRNPRNVFRLAAAVAAIVVLAVACDTLQSRRLVTFGGATDGVALGTIGIDDVTVEKDSAKDAVRIDLIRLSASLLESRGFEVTKENPGYGLSVLLAEKEFVKGFYRLRSVLLEARIVEKGSGSTVAHVRLERETDNTVESAYFLGEIATEVIDALVAEFKKKAGLK